MKPSHRYIAWGVALLAFAALVGPRLLPSHNDSGGARAETPRAGKEGGAPMRVSTFVVRTRPFAETVNATGTVLADESVELQAEITGKIIAIHFKEGARVHSGDLLVKLNDADLRATLGRAAYRKELATLRERRIAQLLKQGVARQEEYDTALSELNIQDAEIQLARAQIAKTEIRAPFDGVVGLRYVSEGAYVNSVTRIAALQRLDNIKIDFALPERYVGRIKVGSTVSFAVAGVAARGKAEIYALDPRIDAGTRMLLIRAISRNPNGALLPGTFANVEVSLDELANAVLIPSEAVIPGVDEKNVFVLADGKARRREVTTGTRTASSIHILKGLEPADVVITSGLQQMREGQAVVAIEAQASATGTPGSAEPSVAAAARL